MLQFVTAYEHFRVTVLNNFAIKAIQYEEEIDAGWMTLKRLSILIESNIRMAERMRLQLSWSFVGDKIRARIRNKDHIMFERFYSGKHTHIHIAEFQDDFSTKLAELDRIWQRDSRLQKRSE